MAAQPPPLLHLQDIKRMRGIHEEHRIIIWVSIIAVGFIVGIGIQTSWAGPTININDDSWLRFDYDAQLYMQWRNTGSSPNQTGDTSNIYFRRDRLTLQGQTADNYGVVFSVEQGGPRRIQDLTVTSNSGNNFDVLDAFGYATVTDFLRLRAGLTKDQLVRRTTRDVSTL